MDAGQTNFIYNKNNNLTYTQDANQNLVNSQKYTFRNYDGLNRLTGIGEGIFGIDSPSEGSQYNSSNPADYLTINVYDTISHAIVDSLFSAPSDYAYPNFTKDNLAATAYRTKTSDNWNFKYYRYDERGRVIKLWNIISGFDTLVTEYIYNSQDQITFVTYQPNKEDLKTYNYTYDYTGRLKDVYYVTGPPSDDPEGFTNLVTYEYNENSQISVQRFNSDVINNTYLYNNRNWISSVTSGGNEFNYQNTYFKNGNVKTQELSGNYNDYFANTSDLTFTYSYDLSNRLLTSASNILYGEGYKLINTYDKDGNLTSLVRHDSAGNETDKFSYNYVSGTNKLDRVEGVKQQFRYDNNGNMIKDSLNSNYNILYDYRNLIIQLSQRKIEGSIDTSIDTNVYTTYYYYDETGNRIRKKVYKFIGAIIPNEEDNPISEDSLSDLPSYWEVFNDEIYSRGVDGKDLCIYKNGEVEQWNIYGLDNVGKLQMEENELMAFYYMKDHLGSVRAIVDEERNIISGEDYDAWGYLLEGRSFESDSSKFKFTGKERDEESDYDYFGARYYDSRIGRWGQVEPLLDKYPSLTPYSYSNDNPLRNIDPNGLEPIKSQVGTVNSYTEILNDTPSRIGESMGNTAEQKLLSLGESELTFNGLQPKNTYFNTTKVRYIYTKYGGWIDMAHFLFYSGRAYTIKGYGESNPIGSAVQEGYLQEFMDPEHTKYSYEDLPSDKFGAIFAIQYFDPNSKSTLAEQISDFLIYTLGAQNPEDAPNYQILPNGDSKRPPSRINKSTKPVYTEENP